MHIFWFLNFLKRGGVSPPPLDCYLPVPQVQLGPQRQILQEQPGLLLSFLIAVFMIFVFFVIV
jgi:hypothetical protein